MSVSVCMCVCVLARALHDPVVCFLMLITLVTLCGVFEFHLLRRCMCTLVL